MPYRTRPGSQPKPKQYKSEAIDNGPSSRRLALKKLFPGAARPTLAGPVDKMTDEQASAELIRLRKAEIQNRCPAALLRKDAEIDEAIEAATILRGRGFTYSEIATRLGVKVSTVSSWFNRKRKK